MKPRDRPRVLVVAVEFGPDADRVDGEAVGLEAQHRFVDVPVGSKAEVRRVEPGRPGLAERVQAGVGVDARGAEDRAENGTLCVFGPKSRCHSLWSPRTERSASSVRSVIHCSSAALGTRSRPRSRTTGTVRSWIDCAPCAD